MLMLNVVVEIGRFFIMLCNKYAIKMFLIYSRHVDGRSFNLPFLEFSTLLLFSTHLCFILWFTDKKGSGVEWNPPDTVQLYNNNCIIISYNKSQLPKSSLLISPLCTPGLCHDVLSYLKQKCLKELLKLLSNHILQRITVDCTCEFIKRYTILQNSTVQKCWKAVEILQWPFP